MLAQIQNLSASSAPASSVVSALNRIQDSAVVTLKPAEAGAVVAVGSIAVSSVEYWNANGDNWLALSATPGSIRPQLFGTGNSGFDVLSAKGPRASVTGGCAIGAADVNAFLSTLLWAWWAGAADLEAASIRAAIASAIAGLRCIL
jgi:hypothetical protein